MKNGTLKVDLFSFWVTFVLKIQRSIKWFWLLHRELSKKNFQSCRQAAKHFQSRKKALRNRFFHENIFHSRTFSGSTKSLFQILTTLLKIFSLIINMKIKIIQRKKTSFFLPSSSCMKIYLVRVLFSGSRQDLFLENKIVFSKL